MRVACLLVLAALCARGQGNPGDLQEPQSQQGGALTGSLTGRVVNSVTGDPVRRATVNLSSSSHGVRSAVTDGQGAFSVPKLPPGDYSLQASHPSYPGIQGLPGSIVNATVSADAETSGVTVPLLPGGSLGGRVVNDVNEPVVGCGVDALGPAQNGIGYALLASDSTNDLGRYTMEPVAAGRYLIYARCQESLPVERPLAPWRPESFEPEESWLPVYYPGSPSIGGAQWLTVLPGSAHSDIDFKLKATPVTSLSVILDGATFNPEQNMPGVTLMPLDPGGDTPLIYGAGFNQRTSTFQFQTIPPGSYRLSVSMMNSRGEPSCYAVEQVNVGTTRPAPMHVQVQPPIALAGMATLPASVAGPATAPSLFSASGNPSVPRPALFSLMLMPAGNGAFPNYGHAEIAPDGTFQFPALLPGRYRLQANIPSAYIESAQLGDTPVENGVFELAAGAGGPLRVRMSANLPRVSADLSGAPASAPASWMIAALPVDQPEGTSMQQLIAGVGQSGSTVQLSNVRPGRFAFVAVSMEAGNVAQNAFMAQLLRRHVEPVEVTPGQELTIRPRFFTMDQLIRLALADLRGTEQ